MIVIKATADKKGQEEFQLKDGQAVYEINIDSGDCVEATLIPMDMKNGSMVYMIDEKTDGKHIYIPAFSRKGAKKIFNAIAS